jgi:UPF0271 protein
LSPLAIDLNADLGEGAGHDEELLALVSSANIATGFHAGDADSMRSAILAAGRLGVAVGAHPSLFDRENFGRKEMSVSPAEVFDAVSYQLGVFQAIAEAAGVRPAHVKPHGALYNMAARDRALAEAVVRAVGELDPRLILFAPPRSQLALAGEARGLQVAREFFADRNYLAAGALVPRTRPDALARDPAEAAIRVLRMLREGRVQSIEGSMIDMRADTICLHGDHPGAVDFAQALGLALKREGVRIRPPGAAHD